MTPCQLCGQKAIIIDSRRTNSGDTRRRFRCKKCEHAWTEWNGIKPKSAAPEIRLSDDAIFDILTDRSPQYVLADRYDCSTSTIGQIRRGEMHPGVHPDIPRFKSSTKTGRKTCRKCAHYTGDSKWPCDLGLKDPIEEGLTFASYCSTFNPILKAND